MTDSAPVLRAALLAWYAHAARDLPWRRTRDPYAIWVSEIMLQQTRVDTVLRYYDRFLARFPTPYALAAADEDAVMAAWSGLGYYRRARMLHAGVREVVARYGGRVPQEPDARRALPGIGRYTAGAIGSIAFGRAEPIVDGNVARVLCRLHAIETPPEDTATQRALWQHAERLVHGEQPGALNQALMELGATVCTKQNPRCDGCPVRAHCRARAQGRTRELPRARDKRPPREVELCALLATHGTDAARALFLDRAHDGLFAGLWNLPMADGHGRDAARALVERSGLRGRLASQPLLAIDHVLTHRRLRVELWPLRAAPALRGGASSGLRAVALAELGTLGISRLTHKALDAAGLGAQLALGDCAPTLERRPRAY